MTATQESHLVEALEHLANVLADMNGWSADIMIHPSKDAEAASLATALDWRCKPEVLTADGVDFDTYAPCMRGLEVTVFGVTGRKIDGDAV